MTYYEQVMTKEGYAYDPVDFGQILGDARYEGRQEAIKEILQLTEVGIVPFVI